MMQPMDDDDATAFSGAITSEPPSAAADSACGLEKGSLQSAQRPPSAAGNSSSKKYQVSETKGQTAPAAQPPPHSEPTAAAVHTGDDGSDSDSDEFHDSESDAGVNYTVVKKSVFKEPKRGGLLSRLKDVSSRSSVRNKYLPTIGSQETAAVVTPQSRRRKSIDDDAPPQIVISTTDDDNLKTDSHEANVPTPAADAYEDDGSGITVAIDNAAAVKEAAAAEAIARAALTVEDATAAHAILQQEEEGEGFGVGPQVVIHSGESDSDSTNGGFATLNPVINSSSKNSKRYPRATTISLTSVTSGSPSTSTTSPMSGAGAVPCLQEIPALVSSDTMPSDQRHQLVLIINALGASGLAKVEKFGTQSTFLELCVVSNGDSSDDSGSVMKTALHKKSGSDAQWNQQFSVPLRSKDAQSLHIAVKTHSKVVIGETRVSLASVGDEELFYDQHYAIFRPMMALTAKVNDESNAHDAATGAPPSGDEVASGSVHLQLKIVDAASVAAANAVVVPPLQLPTHSLGVHHHQLSRTKQQQPVRETPPALRNGTLLFKVPYHSRSIGTAVIRRQWVMVTTSPSSSVRSSFEITWCDPTASATDRKSARSLDLNLVTEVREGHRTKAFERQLQTASSSSVVHERDKCFSLVTKARTLDLVASCKEEARVWVSALRELLFFQSSDGDDSSRCSAWVIEDYKTSALSPRGSAAMRGIGSKPQFYTTTSNSTSSKTKLVTWRNSVFDLARKNRVQEIADCLHDDCPIDLLEPGDGDTILMIACRLGHVQLVELCLSWRAKNDPHPEFGETALQAAVNSSHAKCVTLLLSTAAKSDMDSEIVNHIDSNNDAPLHVAARHGDLACLQLLLHHGADICVVEEFGRTPLHCAVASGHLDCVAYLLDVGGDSVLNAGDHDGDTALHYASLAGNEVIVKLLLESAANVFSANIQNETPYDIALREKQQQCAFLISQYYLTNTKEPSTIILTSPASRNEAASTLLLRQRKQQLKNDDLGENGNGDNYDRECASDSDASTAYAASISPQYSVYERPHPVSAAAAPTKYIDDHHNVEDEDYDVAYTESGHHHRHYDRHQQQHRYPAASSGIATSLATSRLPLSPSDQVREALLRNQSLYRDSPPNPDLRYRSHSQHSQHLTIAAAPSTSYDRAHFCSAREAPNYHQFVSRGALSERIDRDHHHGRSSPQFQYAIQQRGAVQHDDLHHEEYYHHASQYPEYPYNQPAGGRSRSHSDEMRYGYSHQQYHQQQHDEEWRQWNENDSMLHHRQYSQGGRRSNSMDLTMSYHNHHSNRPKLSVRTGWESPSPSPMYQSDLIVSTQLHQASPTTTTAVAPANPFWDTFYTQDGYPYYVHRVTGVSQWETPNAPPPPPPSPSPAISTVFMQSSRSSSHGAGLDTTMSPDSIIRMRLAEARNQKSSSSSNLNTPAVALPPVPRALSEPAPIPPQEPGIVQATDSRLSQAAESGSLSDECDRNAQNLEGEVPNTPTAAVAAAATLAVVSPPLSLARESKFQERTGLKLSVDISSPTRQDETRPVFVPSPRSESPKKNVKDPLDSPIREFEGSFQKSRPSSPRGKSKNIQLIELKRANNLAIALASFKINDQYDQIVSDIVTMNEKTINAELLACLQRFFPTEDERQQLQTFEGPTSRLGKAEQFFFQMLQVPQMQDRIDMFLYKLEFPRTHRSLLSKIQIVKRACRDLVENFSFLQILQGFYDKQTVRKCFQVFHDQRQMFKSEFLPQVDEKLRSFRDDLEKAMGVELMDLQIQFNRLTAGIRPIHTFLGKHQGSPNKHGPSTTDERDLVANGVLQLFVVETRAVLSEIESEYESMGVWEDKLLTVFGESRASCQLSTIVQCVVEILEVAF